MRRSYFNEIVAGRFAPSENVLVTFIPAALGTRKHLVTGTEGDELITHGVSSWGKLRKCEAEKGIISVRFACADYSPVRVDVEWSGYGNPKKFHAALEDAIQRLKTSSMVFNKENMRSSEPVRLRA